MVSINYALREIGCKIVYYGPGLSGKTTNLQFVHGKVPSTSRGDLISLATEADRTLYFDFLPVEVGQIAGFDTKFQLYTVPGQVFYDATRRLVLRGVDGLVFVADSQISKMDENVESLNNMYDNLKGCGIEADSLPLVFQWNKRDLPDILPVSTLEEKLNPQNQPSFEAIATTGVGVFDTLKKVTKMVLEDARARASSHAPTSSPAVTPEPLPVTPPATGQPVDEKPVTVGAEVNAAPVMGRQEPEIVAPNPASAGHGIQAEKPATMPSMSSRPQIAPAMEPVKIHREPSLRVRQKTGDLGSTRVFGAQKSLKIRQRRKSFFARMFGRLFRR